MSAPFGSDDGGLAGGGDGGYSGGSTDGVNPAWNDILSAVPAEYHEKLTPTLQAWDQGVQKRFEGVQSQYKPWEQYAKAGVDPEDVKFALNLLNTLNDDPRKVYEAIGTHFKFNSDGSITENQGPTEQQPGEPNAKYEQRLAELDRRTEIVGQVLLKNQEDKERAKADAALEKEITALKDKHGDFDDHTVLALMANGMQGEAAVKHFQSILTTQAARFRPKPLFMGAGGGIPGQNADVSKLTDQQRKSLAVEILKANAAD